MDRLHELSNKSGGLIGSSTGYKDLDNKLQGLQNGDLIVVAGRPSMGKTSLAMNVAENVL
jgi:replicative DNA helicase